MFSTKFDRIIWSHGHSQPLHKELEKNIPNLTLVTGLPNDIGDPDFFNPNENNLIILDDLLDQVGKDSRITNLFTVSSHHANLTVIFLTQNLYQRSAANRTMCLNSHYTICFTNPRDRGQVTRLGSQMFPGQSQFIKSAFTQATALPYGYLIFDCKPNCLEPYRLRTGLLPQETPYVFVSRERDI